MRIADFRKTNRKQCRSVSTTYIHVKENRKDIPIMPTLETNIFYDPTVVRAIEFLLIVLPRDLLKRQIPLYKHQVRVGLIFVTLKTFYRVKINNCVFSVELSIALGQSKKQIISR